MRGLQARAAMKARQLPSAAAAFGSKRAEKTQGAERRISRIAAALGAPMSAWLKN
jgi:hypothetical protein